MTAFTFDPSNKSATVTLSGGNLVATLSSSPGTARSVLSTAAGSAGQKLYAEFTITGTLASAMAVGLHTTPYPADNTAIGVTANTYAYNSNGGKYDSGVFTGGWGASYGIASGDIISVLFDVDAQTLIVWKNGATQGTLNAAAITGTEFLGLSLYATDIVTLNAGGSAFTYTPPAGYTGWTIPDPTPGIGAGTMAQLTAVGSRIAAGAATMEAFTGSGGYNGIGAVTLEQFTISGAGGPKAGAGTLEVMTASGTGYQAARGAATLESFTAIGTGYDSAIWEFVGSAPVPRLSSTILTGEILSVVVSAPVPLLVAVADNPAIITFAGSAPAPRLVITGLRGNVATALLTAATPIMAAAGYPAYTITFAGSAPAPYLVSVLSGPASTNYRTWVLNTRKGALTSYDNFEFNSFAAFNGVVLGCNSNGIVTLGTQDLDNATAITARVRSGKDSFGSSFHKRVPRCYLGHVASGDLYFRMITNEGGTRTYLLGWNSATGLQQRRVPIGKGPKSRWFQWEVENVLGADFDISNVLLYPTKLRRRVQ